MIQSTIVKCGLCRTLLVVFGLLILSNAHAETVREQLDTMNRQVVAAFNRNDFKAALPIAENALEFARKNLDQNNLSAIKSVNNLAFVYRSHGLYAKAEPLFIQALSLRRQVLGEHHRRTLDSLNSLGMLYLRQGLYPKAEPLIVEALALRRQVLGEHPDTFTSQNDLALLYKYQGEYSKAEDLYVSLIDFSNDTRGENHPETLTSISNLSALLLAQGRYGDAQLLASQALSRTRKVQGDRHPDTLNRMFLLGQLYIAQERYLEALPLYEDALELYQEVVGVRNPLTLNKMTEMARLYRKLGDFDKAEPLLKQSLKLHRNVVGDRHPSTMITLHELARLLKSQSRYEEAEPLYLEALALRIEMLGVDHPYTIGNMNDLAVLYHKLKRFGDAENYFRRAYSLRRSVLGKSHPSTLISFINYLYVLPSVNKHREAISYLRDLEPALLDRIADELYRTESVSVRRSLVSNQSGFQNLALSLAVAYPDEADAMYIAALGTLRFKGLLSEEEAWVARLSRESKDPRVQAAAKNLENLRQQIATSTNNESNKNDLTSLLQLMNEAELELGKLSRDYADHLQVKTANIIDVQAKLSPNTALVEYLRFTYSNFATQVDEERWAAAIFEGPQSIRVVDLGAVDETTRQVQTVMADGIGIEKAARELHHRLIAQLELPEHITRLYFAPDDVLHLLPFNQLVDEQGEYVGERFELRQLLSARDLLRAKPEKTAQGLVALGGIEFGVLSKDAVSDGQNLNKRPSLVKQTVVNSDEKLVALRSITAETFRDGFAELEYTHREVNTIAQLYGKARPEESVEIWSGETATEARLKNLENAPRILHLATHGFYRPARDRTERPMLLAGITLSGANQALSGKTEDGILHAIEVQGLNLEGTELVVLSACETAQGEIAHADGVYGLVRALRTAGARQVLVTLRPVGDASASRFMKRFYENLLAQPDDKSDPAMALQATQSYYIKNKPSFDWMPYVLIGT